MKKLFPLIGLAAATLTLLVAGGASAAAPGSGDAAKPATSAGVESKEITVTESVKASTNAGGYTHLWGAFSGCVRFNLTGLGLPNAYPVAVSASERDAAGTEFIGSAVYTVTNVAVGNNIISARVCIDWPNPILVNIHYVWG